MNIEYYNTHSHDAIKNMSRAKNAQPKAKINVPDFFFNGNIKLLPHLYQPFRARITRE